MSDRSGIVDEGSERVVRHMTGSARRTGDAQARRAPSRRTTRAWAAILVSLSAAGPGHAAGSVQCPEGRGIYQAVAAPSHEMAFAGEKGTLTLTKGRAHVSLPFTLTSTNGFARTNIEFTGKDAPTSVLMSFNPDFTPYRGEVSAPYLVTPDLPASFYYWEPFRSRADFIDLVPGDAWHLVRCATNGR
ncbi:MAG: hypothetical protein INR70_21175 [Parafilimonas terrae]|nr:hypothetical protein [Parafilimonas terrae]